MLTSLPCSSTDHAIDLGFGGQMTYLAVAKATLGAMERNMAGPPTMSLPH